MSATSPGGLSPSPIVPPPERLLHRIDWQVIRRLDGLLQGDYRTLFYGSGVDFADLREYQPPDDIRHIDWNVTARMNSPYVRQYAEERELSAWFLLDLTPSMAFGPPARSKQRLMVELVVTLARLLTRQGNRVGALLYNNRLEGTIPPRGGRPQVLRLARELLRGERAPSGKPTDLTPLIHSGLNTIKRRSLVFLLSDFISEPGWERPLALLNRRHELIALRLWDRREAEMPEVGILVVEDAETGEQVIVDTGDPVFRRRFVAAARRHEANLEALLRRAGADLYSLSTDDDLVRAVLGLAAQRKKRRTLRFPAGPNRRPEAPR